MSHFTHIQTQFKNRFYLEKALIKLNSTYEVQCLNSNTQSTPASLKISQSNGYDIKFEWNGQAYELVVDLSFWLQPYPVESFIDKLSQQYASELIISETQKLGFQLVKCTKKSDKSYILDLEHYVLAN